MNFNDYFDAIKTSESDDWNLISGTTFLQEMGLVTRYNKESPSSAIEDVNEHGQLLIFKPNLSISIALGLKCNADFKSPWAQKFPDKSAHSDYVDFLWEGRPVFRDTIVYVDGARAGLPAPHYEDMSIPASKSTFYELLDQLHGSGEYNNYFRMAGFKLNESDWPA